MIGTRLAHYEITAHLGSGGMGDVYQATDSRLGRSVAIKLLPEAFAHDADRIGRLEREARVLASLNHPNIAAVHGLEDSGGRKFLVMEMVPGETLADRIQRSPMPVEELLAVARQLADALDAAHEEGAVHRDLKPANIKITPDGKVKVLDFGLAKMYVSEDAAPALSNSPTRMSVQTNAGVILGTAAYMSPEQARGREVTRQTDVWAFGCVLFEMLTGRLAFSGETASDIIAKILKEEPDWRSAKNTVPPLLQRLVERCLAKDLRRRFHCMGDVRIALDEPIPEPAVSQPQPSGRSMAIPAVIVIAALAIVITAAMLMQRFQSREAPSWSGTLLGGAGTSFGPRPSPDGKTLAFQALVEGQSQVAVMDPKSGNWNLLTHDRDKGLIEHLSWSGDGTKIYFSRAIGSKFVIYSIPPLGGEPRIVLDGASSPEPLPDESIIVARINEQRRSQLYRFRPDTGKLEALNAELYSAPATVPVYLFRPVPDGHVAFFGTAAGAPPGTAPALYLLNADDNKLLQIGTDIKEIASIEGIGLNAVDKSILAIVKRGDLREILSIPVNGPGRYRSLMSVTNEAYFVEIATDGSLFVDQIQRPLQVIRFNEQGQIGEAVATVPISSPGWSHVLELPDGRILLTNFYGGRARLLAAKPNGEISAFVDSAEESRGPMAFAGPGRVAFVLGTPPAQTIAIASIADGRIVQRLPTTARDAIGSLSASPDGNSFFYTNEGYVWSIAPDSAPYKLGAGDRVAFDPHSHTLVVQLNEKDEAHLVRMPITGGTAEPIGTGGAVLPGASELGPNTVRSDGLIAISVASKESWFFGPGILDPVSGTLRRIPVRSDMDIFALSWNQKNEIVVGSFPFRSTIWRFQQTK